MFWIAITSYGGGILSEDGIEGIKLGKSGLGRPYYDFQNFVLKLYQHGVILAVCSKNDEEDVLRVFREHSEIPLKEKHISCFMVNWENKPSNIERIAEYLNIGLDSIVFVDDSSIEIESVKSLLPEVTAIQFDKYMDYEPFSCFNLRSDYDIEEVEKLLIETVDKYLNTFIDAYIVDEANRYDIKGNSFIGALRKYYFSDTGLRNARLNFSSIDFGQLIENVIYNELIYHGYNVMVGTFNQFEKNKNNESVVKTYEVDFFATKGIESIYIQVTDNIDSEQAKQRELRPFYLIKDANRKVIVVNRPLKSMKLDNGIILYGIVDFIMNL